MNFEDEDVVDVDEELSKEEYKGYSGDFFLCVHERTGWQKYVKRDVFEDVVAWCEYKYSYFE